jgi:hypothetical protein
MLFWAVGTVTLLLLTVVSLDLGQALVVAPDVVIYHHVQHSDGAGA